MYLLNGKEVSEDELLEMARNQYGYEAPFWDDRIIDILNDNGVDVEWIGEEDDSTMTGMAWVIIFLLTPLFGMAQTYVPTNTITMCDYEVATLDLREEGHFLWVTFTDTDGGYVDAVIGSTIPFVPTEPVTPGFDWYCHPGQRPSVDDPRQFRYLRISSDGYGELWLPEPEVCGGLLIQFKEQ
jgi:hypothetical protein